MYKKPLRFMAWQKFIKGGGGQLFAYINVSQ
jgi:hypothetical protein